MTTPRTIDSITAAILAAYPSNWPEDRTRATLAGLPDMEDQTLLAAAGDGGGLWARALGLTGVVEGWYPNGKLWWREHFERGQQHGLSEGWYPNGKPKWRAHWERGQRHGLEEVWYPHGQQTQLRVNTVIANSNSPDGIVFRDHVDLVAAGGVTVPHRLVHLGLFPSGDPVIPSLHGMHVKNYGERRCVFGGGSYTQGFAGVWARNFATGLTYAGGVGFGCRVAYIPQ